MLKCSYCHADYIFGELYCHSCGRPLPPPHLWRPTSEDVPPEAAEAKQQPAPTTGEKPSERLETPPHLRLQLLSGTIIDVGSREQILIGRKGGKQRPEVDLAPYGGVELGVSREHAVIIFQDGQYHIKDLASVNKTLLNFSRLFPGQLYPIKHGDQLQFGELVVTVLL